MNLTPKQQLFVKHYLIEHQGTKAAIAAGYAPASAEVAASRLLRVAKIRAEIDKATTKLAKKLDLSAEKVLRELALMGFSNMMDYIRITPDGSAYLDLRNMTRDQAAAIQECTSETYVDGFTGKGEDKTPVLVKKTKFKLAEKRGSLELLGKHLRLFADQVEHSGAITLRHSVPRPERPQLNHAG